MSQRTYGQLVDGRTHNGTALRAGVFNEYQVRVAAGLTMLVGGVAFVYANFAKVFLPIQTVTTFFFIDFLLRVTVGLHYSPTGVVAGWLSKRQEPMWVSAKPKRFAWALGLIMSGAMMVITNSGIHGVVPRTICLICVALMWLEAVLGVCLGCELYGLMMRRGWTTKDDAIEVCATGACAYVPRLTEAS
jgi:hypothetical protein